MGQLFTPKQITFDATSQRIYWCDREGMRVMSCRTDGSNLSVHVQTGTTAEHRQDRRRHCVGVCVDSVGGFVYWTQKGKPNGNEGRILRAPLHVLPDDPTTRTDIEVLLEALPEPIAADASSWAIWEVICASWTSTAPAKAGSSSKAKAS